MRASTIELILDFTATALINFAFAAPVGALAAAAGGWFMEPQASGPTRVTWSSLFVMALVLTVLAGIAARLAKGIADRGRTSILLTSLACCGFAVSLAGPMLRHVQSRTMPGASALLPVVLLLVEAGLLAMSAWQLEPPRPRAAG